MKRNLYLLIFLFLFSLFSIPMITNATWWNSSWGYRQLVNVTVLTGNKTNPQVNITIDTQTLVSANKLNANCSDVRFTWYNTTDGTESSINYWNETPCNTTATKYWVNPPLLINASNLNNNTIYMYYGNPSASVVAWTPAYNISNYTTAQSTTWTAPAGITNISAETWGGGGGGAGWDDSALCFGGATIGAGGGGGYSKNSSTPLTIGTSYTVVVGAGGAGGVTSGNDGGTSSFGSATSGYCHAHGGGGGGAGAGGQSSAGIGDVKYTGGAGGGPGSCGAGGGAGSTGNGNSFSGNSGGAYKAVGGGAGGSNTGHVVTGEAGSQAGGGGAGGWSPVCGVGTGGAGANGTVTLTYLNSTNVTLFFYTEESGNTPPYFSANATNTTGAGFGNNFSITISGYNQVDGYIFSTNNSGTWKNSSYIDATNANTITAWNVTTLNSTVGALVQWMFYANDTSNNWNSSAIYNLTTTYATAPTIVSKGNDAYALKMSSDGSTLKGYINNIEIAAPVSAPTSWHHYVLTYDGSNQKLYIDGVLANSTSLTGAISTNANNVKIGEYFSGSIDEVKIYNRSLSADEVKADYELGIKKLSSTGRTDLISTSTNVYLVLANPNGHTHFDEVKIKTNKRNMMLSIPYLNVDLNGTARFSKGNNQLTIENKGFNTTLNRPIIEIMVA